MTLQTYKDENNVQNNSLDQQLGYEPDGETNIPPPRAEYRSYVRHLCSVIGFALCVMFLLIQAVGLGSMLFLDYLEAGGLGQLGETLYRILDSGWFYDVGVSLLGYGVSIPVLLLVLHRVPEVKAEPKKMRLRKFIMFFVIAMGIGYIFNFAGNIINMLLGFLTERRAEDMNPITDMFESLTFASVLYVSVLGPIIEELIFRKIILNRVRPLGEKAAIIFTAVLFGLLHGNIAQLLYATFIGIIFGYVAVKTGRIFYCVILHIMVNSYSVFLVTGLITPFADNTIILGLVSLGILVVSFAFVVSAIALVVINAKKTHLKCGDVPKGVGYRDFSSAMFLNPGVAAFFAICFFMIVFYAFFA